MSALTEPAQTAVQPPVRLALNVVDDAVQGAWICKAVLRRDAVNHILRWEPRSGTMHSGLRRQQSDSAS